MQQPEAFLDNSPQRSPQPAGETTCCATASGAVGSKGEQGLAQAKRRNYARYVLSLLEQGSTAHNTPLEFFLESANSCNLNCKFCALHVKQDRVKGAQGIMPAALIRSVDPWLAGAASVSLHGFGEPLMNPRLVESATAAAEHGAFVEFFTNGRMLTERRARALVSAGVARIFVSISSADPAQYEHFYERGRFQLLTENLEALRDLKRAQRTPRPELHFNCIALRSTLPGLVDLVEYAARVGATGVHLKPLVTYETNPAMHGESLYYDYEQHEPLLQEAERHAQRRGVGLYAATFRAATAPACQHEPAPLQAAPLDAPLRIERPCPLIYRTMYVTVNGETKPCCFGSASPELSLGNVRELGVEGVWNGDGFRALREAHQRGEVPPICEHCVRFNLAPPSDPASEWLTRQGFPVANYQALVDSLVAAGQSTDDLAQLSRRWLEDGCTTLSSRTVVGHLRRVEFTLSQLLEQLVATDAGELLEPSRQQVGTVHQLAVELVRAIEQASEPPTPEDLADALRSNLLPVLERWQGINDEVIQGYYDTQRAAASL